MSDLMQKLAISKAIMDRHNTMGRGNAPEPTNIQTPMVESYDVPAANFNIPIEFISESNIPSAKSELPPKDRILNSKLPDEIKRLMIEHPISQPNNMGGGGSVLSNELVEKAARLMNNDVANNVNPYQPKKVIQETKSQNITSHLDKSVLKDIIKETIEEVLSENGLLIENTSKTNDMFQFRVGSHIFEGKVTRIKKIK